MAADPLPLDPPDAGSCATCRHKGADLTEAPPIHQCLWLDRVTLMPTVLWDGQPFGCRAWTPRDQR